MFRGNKAVKLDGKGRVSIPAQHRARLLESSAGKVVVSPDFHSRCLNIYPLNEWENVEEKIGALSGKQQTALRRYVIGRAQECEMDGNGRILLNQELCLHADLEKEAVLVGVGFKLELWDQAAWDAITQQEQLSENDLEQLQDVYI